MFSTTRFVCASVLTIAAAVASAQRRPVLSQADLDNVRQIVQQQIQQDRARSTPLTQQPIHVYVDSAAPPDSSALKLWVPAAVAFLSSLIALGGVLFVSRQTVRTTERMIEHQNKQKFTELVLDGLRFFGSSQGTQSRSVGIAIIRANFKNPDFTPFKQTWCSVLEYQALYLLSDSKERARPDEIANLRSIVLLLKEAGTSHFDVASVQAAAHRNKTKGSKSPGLDLTGPDGQIVLDMIMKL